MTQLHRAYPGQFEIGPPAVAQLSGGEARSPRGPRTLALFAGAEIEDPLERLESALATIGENAAEQPKTSKDRTHDLDF